MTPDTLEEALKQLAEANSQLELIESHKRARAAVKARRKDAPGSLATQILEAVRIRREMKQAGATNEELAAGFEQVVRDVWPKPHGRSAPWRYECSECNDTGLRMRVCRAGERCDGISTRIDHPNMKPGKYPRICARAPESDYEHDYGTPCFCSRGARFTEKPKGGGDDFTTATKGPRGMTRFGK